MFSGGLKGVPMDEDPIWRKRLLLYTLVRAGGLIIFFFGIAIIYTNLLRSSGWPQVGAIVAILGALVALGAPRLLRRAWQKQDRSDEPASRDADAASRPSDRQGR
jgi:membrane protein implicated in regulation of membrane protease activity